MTDDLIALFLLRAHIAASVAILVVLAFRHAVRRLIGPEMGYQLWALVPVATTISLFPSLADFITPLDQRIHEAGLAIPSDLGRLASAAAGYLPLYVGGAAVLAAAFLLGEWRFRRLAGQGRVGPAVVGVAWPRIVTPSDYEARFDAAERRLIRMHERTHIAREHPRHNRLIAAAQLIGWFNPLVHLAAHCARLDQEIACDAEVMANAPSQRRLYAQTLLKAQDTGAWSALACALTHGGRHPLEVRIDALKRRPLSLKRYFVGVGVVVVLGAITALSLWTLSPQAYG